MAKPDPNDPNTWLIATLPALRQHRLWAGSLLQQSFALSGLSRGELLAAYTRLAACDDLTQDEVTYLAAMRETLDFNEVPHD